MSKGVTRYIRQFAMAKKVETPDHSKGDLQHGYQLLEKLIQERRSKGWLLVITEYGRGKAEVSNLSGIRVAMARASFVFRGKQKVLTEEPLELENLQFRGGEK